VSYDLPHIYALDLTAYQKSIKQLKSQTVKTTTKKNKIFTTYVAKKRTSLIYTLPYDKGWFAKQNGKAIKISKAQNGLMKIDVSKGSGKIIMTFVPQGLYQGILLTCLGIFLFVFYQLYYKKFNLK
ncbi:YfhO family protein, partial [Streptococcus mutans]|nr:YfhO family protein [Streptococcus mutans]